MSHKRVNKSKKPTKKKTTSSQTIKNTKLSLQKRTALFWDIDSFIEDALAHAYASDSEITRVLMRKEIEEAMKRCYNLKRDSIKHKFDNAKDMFSDTYLRLQEALTYAEDGVEFSEIRMKLIDASDGMKDYLIND